MIKSQASQGVSVKLNSFRSRPVDNKGGIFPHPNAWMPCRTLPDHAGPSSQLRVSFQRETLTQVGASAPPHPPPAQKPALLPGQGCRPRQAQEDLHELNIILKDCVDLKTTRSVLGSSPLFFFSSDFNRN